MRQKLPKRIFASVLVFAMTVCTFTQYVLPAQEVQAEAGNEPTYNAAAHDLKYSKDVSNIAAGGDASFGTALPTSETCYVSFEIQAGDAAYFDFYGKAAMARVYLAQKQYGLLNFEKETWPQGAFGLSDGAKITYSQGPEGISIWINGVLKHENLKPKATANGNAPRVIAVNKSVTVKNFKVWTIPSDEPVYKESADELKYSKDTIDVAANADYPFGITISKDETYYMSFELKSDTEVYFDFQGKTSLARIHLAQDKYRLLNFAKDETIQEDIGLSKGVRVTYAQGSEGISIWFNGVKVQENLQPKTAGDASPRVQWVKGAASLKNVKIWMVKEEVPAESDEPVYNASKHSLTYDKDADKIAAGGGGVSFGTPLPTTETYYVSFEVQTEDAIYLDFYGKGAMARAYFAQKQYGLLNLGKEQWPQGSFGLSDGVRITYSQGPEGISLWINGVKKHENLKPDSTENGNAPRVRSCNKDVNLKNVKVWTILDDEPKYDAASQELKCSEEAITVAANKDYPFGLIIPKDETYYMTFEVKSDTEVYFDFCGKTSLARIHLAQDKYRLLNFEQDKTEAGDFGLAKGVRITYSCGPDGVSLWMDGVKQFENLKPKTAADGSPRVQWVKGEASLKAIQVWTAKNSTEEPIVSDAPVYDPQKHVLHVVEGSKGGTYKDGVLTLDPLSSGYFNTDLDGNADYYMSFIVKARNPVNISYRHPKGLINIQSGGFESIGTTGKFVNKNFSKLAMGIPVTVHSTPNWITIWVNGEKILDEAYTVTGECRPGISWSFNEVVTVSDVKIWSDPIGIREDLGEITVTQKSPLLTVREYGVPLRAEATKKAYVDSSPVGVNAQKSVVKVTDGQSEIIASDIKTQGQKINLVKASVPIVGALVMLAIVIMQIIKRKKMQ